MGFKPIAIFFSFLFNDKPPFNLLSPLGFLVSIIYIYLLINQ